MALISFWSDRSLGRTSFRWSCMQITHGVSHTLSRSHTMVTQGLQRLPYSKWRLPLQQGQQEHHATAPGLNLLSDASGHAGADSRKL
jgi:hypothetical protein